MIVTKLAVKVVAPGIDSTVLQSQAVESTGGNGGDPAGKAGNGNRREARGGSAAGAVADLARKVGAPRIGRARFGVWRVGYGCCRRRWR